MPNNHRSPGRPEVTSHAEIESQAFRLFAERGYEATTVEAIAAAVGISRRTLFHYYPSKNDIPWGRFDLTLDHFAVLLREQPDDLPLWEVVHRAVRSFNDFPADAQPPHVERMRLILHTPALQSHSVLRYAEWREVVASFVAERTGQGPDDALPVLVGHVSLALAHAAYDAWLAEPSASLPDLVSTHAHLLRDLLTDRPSLTEP